MSDFDESHLFQPPQPSSPVWGLAAFSAAVFLCSVLGAKLLAGMLDDDNLPKLAYERSMRGVERAQAAQQPQVYTVVRSVGVDGMATATIPVKSAAPVSPCGDGHASGQASGPPAR